MRKMYIGGLLFSVLSVVHSAPAFSEEHRLLQRAQILMDFNIRTGSGSVAVVWTKGEGTAPLSDESARIVLAAFVYARTLIIHKETRNELMQRVRGGAEKLRAGGKSFEISAWDLEAGGMRFTIYPPMPNKYSGNTRNIPQ